MTTITDAKIVHGCNSRGAWTGMTYKCDGETLAAHQSGHWTRAEMLHYVANSRENDRNREDR